MLSGVQVQRPLRGDTIWLDRPRSGSPWKPTELLYSRQGESYCYGKHIDWNHPPWPGTIVTICMSCFRTGGPGTEQGTNKPPPTGRVLERSKVDTTCLITSQNPLQHPSWLNKASTTRKDSESEWLAKDNLGTDPITIKPETSSHVAEQFSWVPLPLSTRAPFPNKISCFVSTCVSSDSSFPSVRQDASFGPWRGWTLPVKRKHWESCEMGWHVCKKTSNLGIILWLRHFFPSVEIREQIISDRFGDSLFWNFILNTLRKLLSLFSPTRQEPEGIIHPAIVAA